MPIDYEDIEAFLVGTIGMTEEQAGRTSYREFLLRAEGHRDAERREWERARWQMFLLMQMHPNIKKHHKPKTPQEWIPFEWERKKRMIEAKAPKRCKVTKKEMDKLEAIFNETINRK